MRLNLERAHPASAIETAASETIEPKTIFFVFIRQLLFDNIV
jgi:hypothetical protein